jgi:hypothetical protein
MADNRIYGEFLSYTNIRYKIFIYDAEFVADNVNAPIVIGDPATGDVWGWESDGGGNVWGWSALDELESVGGLQTLHVSVGGFTLEYETTNENLYTPLMPSKVSWKMMFQNEEQETFLNALANSYEGQFLVRILKNDELYWVGVLLPDVVQFEDQYYPYEFAFTAVDGLARLKSIPYPTANVVYGSAETLLNMVLSCLGQLETSVFFTSIQDFFVNNVNWWETRHVAAFNKDPLTLTRFNPGALYEEDSTTDEVTVFTCFQILEQICTVFGARLFLADGRWYMQQVTAYDNSVQPRKVYRKNGTLNSWTGGAAYDETVNQVTLSRAEGRFEYLPPLRSVTATYKHRSGTGTLLQGISWDWITDGATVIFGEIGNNGGTAKLKFEAKVEHTYRTVPYADMPDPAQSSHRFALTIQVGTHYYVGDEDNGAAWTTTPGVFTFETGLYRQWENNISIFSLTTSEVPVNGTGSVKFEYVETVAFPSSVATALPLQISTIFDLVPEFEPSMQYWMTPSPLLVVLSDGNETDSYDFIQYAANNANTTNTKKVEIVTYFGDGPYANSPPRMETYNGSTWGNSTKWGISLSGPRTQTILSLLVTRIMQAQAFPRLKYVGKLIDTRFANYQAFSRLKINEKYYVFLGGAFVAETDTWENLHVFHIKTDISINPPVPAIPK